uniref:Uncharacterized protein n=1 Tax=Ascaris lumbricoides TaxID=6252 RepID=A0A0M3IWE2_ASCLU
MVTLCVVEEATLLSSHYNDYSSIVLLDKHTFDGLISVMVKLQAHPRESDSECHSIQFMHVASILQMQFRMLSR